MALARGVTVRHGLHRLQVRATVLAQNRSRQRTVSAAAKMRHPSDAYDRLKGKKVTRSSDFVEVDVPSLWGPDDKAVVAFTRELAIQLRRDLKPELDKAGVKLFLLSIGTKERSIDFAGVTGFPRELLLADPDSVTYEALGLVKGIWQTFFGAQTAFSFLKRLKSKEGLKDLKDVLGRWKPWIPPKQNQAFQQGGMFVFDGTKCIWSHYDQATGDHADFEEVLKVATGSSSANVSAQRTAATASAKAGADCGCDS